VIIRIKFVIKGYMECKVSLNHYIELPYVQICSHKKRHQIDKMKMYSNIIMLSIEFTDHVEARICILNDWLTLLLFTNL